MKQGLSCPSCGSPITPGYKFCGTCGRPLYQPIPESANYNYVIEPPARKGGGIVGVIRKMLGGLLIGIGFFLHWIIQIALFVFLCFYVVDGFINGGLWAGLFSIFFGGILCGLGCLLFGWIGIGLMAAGSTLWGE